MDLEPHQARRWYLFGCLFEAGLGMLAILLGALLRLPLWPQIRFDPPGALWGVAGALPLFGLFVWMLRSQRSSSLREIHEFLENSVRPILGRWSIPELAVISMLAGVGEELLFRGVLQAGIARATPAALALVLTSIAFGVCHAVTRAYAVIAGLISGYLGVLLWIGSGNLLVPILTHASYDFLALIYFLRIYGSGKRLGSTRGRSCNL